jgi:hypothetical protein
VAEISKVVRFFEPVRITSADKRIKFKAGFWGDLTTELTKLGYKDRQYHYSGYDYYGTARTGVAPALPYFYIGRLRPHSDWPDTFDQSSGTEGDLQVGNKNIVLMEPTFLVPFGTQNYVAMLSPLAGGSRTEALDTWLTGVSGLQQQGERIELTPLINRKVLLRLQAATGVTKLEFHVMPDEAPPPSGGGVIGDSVRAAVEARGSVGMAINLSWSFSQGRGDQEGRGTLLEGAKWLVQQHFSDRARASMLLEKTDGNRIVTTRESHELFEDKVAFPVKLVTQGDNKPDEKTILSAAQTAIDKFRAQA